MNKIRIGIDARLCGTQHAGLGRYIKNLCLRLPLYLPPEFQLIYFLADKSQYHELMADFTTLSPDNQLSAQEFLSRLEVVMAPIPHYSLAEQIKLPALYAQAKLDLLHVPHFNAPYFSRVPKLVVTIHDLLWHEKKGLAVTTLPAWQYYFKYAAYRTLVNRVVHHSQAIIVPSQTIANTFDHIYPTAHAKLQPIYNGTTDFQSIKATANFATKLPKQYLLYVGSLYPHKNINLVLQVMTQNQNLNLVMVSARDAFTKQTKAQVKNLDLTSRVTFLSGVSDGQLKYLYEHAQALVQPSLSEGFGLTGIEAMKCACPVLASDIPIFQEVYGQHYYRFDPRDTQSFQAAYDQLLHDLPTLIRQKLTAYASRYNWDQMTREVIKVYQEVLTP
ncbi:glycosyltransferase family 4 protein [bacterium]|nr:glycosyltransferase family 4 protein [bacterium]